MDDETRRKAVAALAEAKKAVLDKLVAAGWVEFVVRNEQTAVFQPTQTGWDLIRGMRELLIANGKPIAPIEFTALCEIIRNLEPLG